MPAQAWDTAQFTGVPGGGLGWAVGWAPVEPVLIKALTAPNPKLPRVRGRSWLLSVLLSLGKEFKLCDCRPIDHHPAGSRPCLWFLIL